MWNFWFLPSYVNILKAFQIALSFFSRPVKILEGMIGKENSRMLEIFFQKSLDRHFFFTFLLFQLSNLIYL